MTAPSDSQAPRTVRRIGSPAAAALGDLAAIFDDLQTTLTCCERALVELARPEPESVVVESLWTTALLSYTRCFAPGGRGMGLTEDDVTATELSGDVLPWHRMLRQLRKHYADPATNPRESFSVGVAVSEGTPQGVAITSTRQDLPDEQTIRQTGIIAMALYRRVDERITEHQATVLEGARALSPAELETLDEVELAGVDGVGEPGAAGSDGAPAPGRTNGTNGTNGEEPR